MIEKATGDAPPAAQGLQPPEAQADAGLEAPQPVDPGAAYYRKIAEYHAKMAEAEKMRAEGEQIRADAEKTRADWAEKHLKSERKRVHVLVQWLRAAKVAEEAIARQLRMHPEDLAFYYPPTT
jgi:hypothetical protein